MRWHQIFVIYFCSFFINFKTNASESIYYVWFTQTSISVHEYFHYEFYPLSHNTVCCIYAVSYTHLDVYKRQVLSLVLFRTDLSIQLTTLIQQVRIHQLLSLVSVIQIWLLRWLNTARIIFFHRLDSQCFHRLISRHREFFHSYSNIIKKSGARTAVMSQLWLFFNI